MSDYWISQTGSGIANASSAATSAPYTFFNSASNWSQVVGTIGKISPGDYVHIVSIISGQIGGNGVPTGLSFQGGGKSHAQPITLLFEPGAKLSSPYWGQAGGTTGGSAIYGGKASYIVIDGSGDGTYTHSGIGIIECTDNGASGYDNAVLFSTAISNLSQSSTASWSGWIIRNLNIQNMMVPVFSGSGFASTGQANSYGMLLQDGSDITISNCFLTNSSYGINMGSADYAFMTGWTISGCFINGCAVSIAIGVGLNQVISGIKIIGNNLVVGVNWTDSHDTHHLNPLHIFGQAGLTAMISGALVDSNIMTGDGGQHMTAMIYLEDEIINPIVTNNLLFSYNNTPDDGHIDIKRLVNAGAQPNYPIVANNTIVGLGSGTFGGRGIYFQDTVNDYYTVQNNIIANVSDAIYSQSPVVLGTYSGDYNDFYNVGNIAFWANKSWPTLTGWQSGVTGEMHSITGNPLFINTGASNYQLSGGSAALRVGANLSFVFTNDILGRTRQTTGPWDLGCYYFPALSNIYIAHNALGIGDGSSALNAAPYTFFNTASNWSSPNFIDGKISPSTVVHLVGTISGQLVAQSSGVATSGITIYFEPNAVLTSSSGFTAGAISLPSNPLKQLQYFVIDGGVNGVINTTNNGNTLAYQTASVGVYLQESANIIVRNLTFANLYQRSIVGSGSDPTIGGYGVYLISNGNAGNTGQNITVTNCLFHDMHEGFAINYGLGYNNITYSYCNAYNVNWGGHAGDSLGNSTLSGLYVHHNNFHDFIIWDDSSAANTHHHNGFFTWCVQTGFAGQVATNTAQYIYYYDNLIGPGFSSGFGRASSAVFIQGRVGNAWAFNNILIGNEYTGNGVSGDAPSDGFVYFNPYLTASGNYYIFNNTIIGPSTGAGVGIDITNIEPAAPSGNGIQYFYTYNNLINTMGTVINTQSGVSTGNNLGFLNLIFDYNFGYNVNPVQAYSIATGSSSKFLTFTGWQASGYDSHGNTGLAIVLDQNYKLLIGTSIIGSGLNLYQYFQGDYLGNIRPSSGPWDVGAYMFVGVQNPFAYGILL